MKLEDIHSPSAVKGLPEGELNQLAEELREEIIRTVSENGGHLASNLGVVELTVALHRVFDCPTDKIVFDVGHQCYPHKLLTGRAGSFSTLRKLNGVCGFPRREESEYDAFNTGHASTAISAALGMARARDMRGEKQSVVAVVGDGALTGGMCYEALNDAGSLKTQFMVVINDNGMSISRNVGALSRQLTRMRISRGWLGMKKNVADTLRKVPGIGNRLHDAFQKIKNGIRNAFIRDKYFTALGFQYFGPIDGHDIHGMEKVFRSLKNVVDHPVVVHVVTKKGCGFDQAEEAPEKYHGVAPFYIETGRSRKESSPSVGMLGGQYIAELAEKRPDICVVTAAMTESTGFGPFQKKFPGRLFDVGIAEEHAVTLAAGMAAGGMRPIVAIYETFLQRAFDQITVDVCLQKLPVCFLMDRAGIGGEDGATHHGLLGVSMLRSIPNMTVFAPRCEQELKSMIDWALRHDSPCAIRYPRSLPKLDAPEKEFFPGHWEELRKGKDAAILASSAILEQCMETAKLLSEDGIEVRVVNASSVCPLDEDYLKHLVKKQIPVCTVEEHYLAGGFGSAVAEFYANNALPVPAAMIGLPGEFIPHGSRKLLLKRYGLDAEGIAEQVKKAVKQ